MSEAYRKWMRENPQDYQLAHQRGLLGQIKKDLGWVDIRWTKQKVLNEALKYNLLDEWRKKSPKSYGAAVRNKWLKDATKHMLRKEKPKGYWDFDAILEDANKYQTLQEWVKKSCSGYGAAKRKGVYKRVKEIMGWKGRVKWTKKNVIAESKNHKSKTSFRKNKGAYQYAVKNNILHMCEPYKQSERRVRNSLTLSIAIGDAIKHKTLKAWYTKSKSIYTTAWKNGWLPEIKKKMGW
jgi:hypothetical protein